MKTKHNSQTAAQSMAAPSDLFRKLQKADRKQAALYLFCNFVSLLLITAYSAMMFSPTVLLVLPEGGDSRKQMIAIFVLALFGCVVFTIYASHLFFRKKAKQLGTLMALGASRRWIAPGLFREVITLSGFSSLLGIAAGLPFTCLLWSMFRLFLVNSEEMRLVFDFKCLYLSLVFFLLVVAFSCMTAYRYLKRTNIMDVVHEEHKNEPVKELGRWCGPAGLLLLFGGAVLGYCAPYIYMNLFGFYYPPAWLNLFYAPVFVGLYLIMLHTVVHGWRSRKKHPYKNIISRSMMKFQGKQTVNNLIIVTILIAGACFAIFYLPAVSSGALLGYAERPFDYYYEYRADQRVPGEEAVKELAGGYQLTLKDWEQCEYITVGAGGRMQVEEADGRHFHVEYMPVAVEMNLLSEDAYRVLTGEAVKIDPGTYRCVTNRDESSLSTNESAEHLTNMTTRMQLEVSFAGYLHYDLLVGEVCFAVVSNEDYAKLAEGLSDEWRGGVVQFNVDQEDSYAFAKDFYHRFVSSFDESCEYAGYYDRVYKIVLEEEGKDYWGDSDPIMKVHYEELNSSTFKLSWRYQPRFRILDQNDFLVMMAVFFMMFLFIFIVCLTTALVVCYTRCQTIALNNRYIFDDLRKLGASPDFMGKEVCSQCSNVFRIPALVGTGAMYLLFAMILYANDGQIIFSEIIALSVCFGVILLVGIMVFLVYRLTVRNMKKQLEISV